MPVNFFEKLDGSPKRVASRLSFSSNPPRSMKNRMLLFDSRPLRLNNPRVIRAWNLQFPRQSRIYISKPAMLKLFFHYPTEILFIFLSQFSRQVFSRWKPPRDGYAVSIDDKSIALWSSSCGAKSCSSIGVIMRRTSPSVYILDRRNRYREIRFLVVALFRETGEWCRNRSMTDFHDRVYRPNSFPKGKGSFPIIFLRRSLSREIYLEMYKSWREEKNGAPVWRI